ncbi:polysaccharide deacetylase family protein [bacterium]|nr:polysaccharide deacetylase family protein [candidate division CSSED10-310 bacterium]
MLNRLKRCGMTMGYSTGVLRLLARRRPPRGLVVVAYHQLAPPQYLMNLLGMEPVTDSFAAQVRFLRRAYEIVDLYSWLKTGRPERGALAITFDDGYMDVFTHAFPVLKELEVPATVFLVPGCMDSREALWLDRLYHALHATRESGLSMEILGQVIDFPLSPYPARALAVRKLRDFCKALDEVTLENFLVEMESRLHVDSARVAELQPLLHWDQVRMMSGSGIRFGSHSHTHQILSRISDGRLHCELTESRRRITEETGTVPTVLAYPNGGPGDFDQRVVIAAGAAGYEFGMTFMEGLHRFGGDPYRVPRIGVFGANVAEFSTRLVRKTILRREN